MKRNVADFGGATGAVLAALCCSGNALIVGALASVGLGFLKNDAVLWPLMLGSLVVALYGFWRGWRMLALRTIVREHHGMRSMTAPQQNDLR